MAAEEVGARLVAYGEEEFVTAFQNCQKSIDHLETSLKDADKAAQQSGNEMTKASKKFTVFGQSLTDIKSGFEMAFGAFEQGYAFVKTFIDSASNMNETVSKSKVVFGDMAAAVEDMGNRAAQSMGLSKQEAIAAAATYGNLFVSMGMASDTSADMSMNLVQLASDLASFNNIPVADALDKIRAGLVGEAEPLKTLGINLNEATLKQKAMSLGLSDGKGVLDASAKAQAAYAIMLEQSTTAQGDFARTADGVANQQRILEAETKNLTAAIGQQLLPVWKDMLKIANQSISTLSLMVTREQQLQDVLKDHSQEVAKTTGSYAEYVKEMTRAANVAGFGVDANGNLTKSYKGIFGIVTEVVQEHALLTAAELEQVQASEKMDQALKDTKAAAQVTAAGFDEFSSSLGAATQNANFNKDALEKLKQPMLGVNVLMQDYTKQLLFNQAAAGLDAEASLILADRMGLIYGRTQEAMGELAKLKSDLDAGKITVQEYADKVANLNDQMNKLKSKTVSIDVITTYKYFEQHGGEAKEGAKPERGGEQLARGGSFVMPDWVGYEGWQIGPGITASGGERVTVSPKGMSNMLSQSVSAALSPLAMMRAAPSSYSYSTANNYNLNVMTSQSPALVQRSFAMMKLLAG